jgi:hypothetical protein
VAIRSGENFSAKHFSVIAFLKKLVTLGILSAPRGGALRFPPVGEAFQRGEARACVFHKSCLNCF